MLATEQELVKGQPAPPSSNTILTNPSSGRIGLVVESGWVPERQWLEAPGLQEQAGHWDEILDKRTSQGTNTACDIEGAKKDSLLISRCSAFPSIPASSRVKQQRAHLQKQRHPDNPRVRHSWSHAQKQLVD